MYHLPCHVEKMGRRWTDCVEGDGYGDDTFNVIYSSSIYDLRLLPVGDDEITFFLK